MVDSLGNGFKKRLLQLINGYGISEGKSNLATRSFGFWNNMDINGLEREFEFSKKGI